MSDKYKVTLSDGRAVIVTTEGGPPSEADVMAFLSQGPAEAPTPKAALPAETLRTARRNIAQYPENQPARSVPMTGFMGASASPELAREVLGEGAGRIGEQLRGIPQAVNPLPQDRLESLLPYEGTLIKRMIEAGMQEAREGATPLGGIPIVGPLAGQMGRDIGGKYNPLTGRVESNVGGAAVNAAQLAASFRAPTGAASGVVSRWRASRAANAYSRAQKATINLSQTLGKDAGFHDAIAVALPQIVEDSGGLQNLLGQAPKGATRRLAEGASISAARQAEYVRSNFINHIGNEPFGVTEIIPNLRQLATKAFRIAEPDTAALIRKAVDTGALTGEEVYSLKSRLNAIADPAYKTAIGDIGAPSPKIAKAAAKRLQSKLADRLGPDYLAADRLQGKIGELRNAAIETADIADNMLPDKKGISFETGVETARGNLFAGSRAVKALMAKAKHPDITIHAALQDIPVGPGARPSFAAEVGANLRAPGQGIVGPQQAMGPERQLPSGSIEVGPADIMPGTTGRGSTQYPVSAYQGQTSPMTVSPQRRLAPSGAESLTDTIKAALKNLQFQRRSQRGAAGRDARLLPSGEGTGPRAVESYPGGGERFAGNVATPMGPRNIGPTVGDLQFTQGRLFRWNGAEWELVR
jgi:hypothetical protein